MPLQIENCKKCNLSPALVFGNSDACLYCDHEQAKKFYNDEQKVDPSELTNLGELGSGAFGAVFLTNFNDKLAACKMITFNKDSCQSFFNEITLMLCYEKHENVLSPCAFFVQPRRKNYRMFILSDFMFYGNLNALEINLLNAQKISIATDVLKGLKFIHSKYILHNDISLRNIFIDGNLRAKLADFGLAEFFDPEDPFLPTKSDMLDFLKSIYRFFGGRLREVGDKIKVVETQKVVDEEIFEKWFSAPPEAHCALEYFEKIIC